MQNLYTHTAEMSTKVAGGCFLCMYVGALSITSDSRGATGSTGLTVLTPYFSERSAVSLYVRHTARRNPVSVVLLVSE